MSINVLLVEDDIDLASTVVDYLEIEGISCDHASNGLQGLALFEANTYQVVLLDLNLPRLDGLSICQKVRSDGNETPILMLTARDSLGDKAAGFSAGTDDYLVKPFEIEELLMRVIALSTRKSGQVSKLTLNNLELNTHSRSATYAGEALKLTPITFKILQKLMRETSSPVSREVLMQAIWGDEQPDSNSLKVHIHHLRKQLTLANAKLSIENEAGFGFVLRATQ
ncbi:response regulator transcription factor [Pseudocolwellia sp. HL-MZ19]|uniref:response regulator transcription factor n=1 Tax=unclassified Pseudocolwellia TaxID=2848178 RepID=UPI003CF25879